MEFSIFESFQIKRRKCGRGDSLENPRHDETMCVGHNEMSNQPKTLLGESKVVRKSDVESIKPPANYLKNISKAV